MEFWDVEEHEVAYSWLRTSKMWLGNGVLGRRRAGSGLQLAPGIQNVGREWSSGNTKSRKWPTVGSGHPECGPGMEFWEVEEHEVAYSWLRAFKMWPGNGVLGTRRARSGLQLAPGIQNVAREWSSGKSKSTKWPTVGSGHSECGPGMEFWEVQEHEVCDCLLKTSPVLVRLFRMWPGNGVLGGRRARSV